MPRKTKPLNIDEMFELLYKLKRQREKDGTADVIEFDVIATKENLKLLRKAGFKICRKKHSVMSLKGC